MRASTRAPQAQGRTRLKATAVTVAQRTAPLRQRKEVPPIRAARYRGTPQKRASPPANPAWLRTQ
jgi:hypothetical protein